MLAQVFDACGLDGESVRHRLSYVVAVESDVTPQRLLGNVLAQSAPPIAVSIADAVVAADVGPELDAAGIAVATAELDGRVVYMRGDQEWSAGHASTALASLEVTGSSSVVNEAGLAIAANHGGGGRQVVAWWLDEETSV